MLSSFMTTKKKPNPKLLKRGKKTLHHELYKILKHCICKKTGRRENMSINCVPMQVLGQSMVMVSPVLSLLLMTSIFKEHKLNILLP